jgi:hypothetical protein
MPLRMTSAILTKKVATGAGSKLIHKGRISLKFGAARNIPEKLHGSIEAIAWKTGIDEMRKYPTPPASVDIVLNATQFRFALITR